MRYLVTMTVDIEEVTMRKPGRPRKAVPDSDVSIPSPLHATSVQQVAYGIREAANVLGISRSSVYKLIKEKRNRSGPNPSDLIVLVRGLRRGRAQAFHRGRLEWPG
jgi:hypothetical protein